MTLIYGQEIDGVLEEPFTGFIDFYVEPGVVLIRTDGLASFEEGGDPIRARWISNSGYIKVYISHPSEQEEITELKIEKDLEITNYLLKVELQEIAEHLGLSTSGLKAEIIDRIKQHLGIE